MTASETPANPIGSTLIALARAIERLHEILEHPAVQSAYGAAPDQLAEGGAPTVDGPVATPGQVVEGGAPADGTPVAAAAPAGPRAPARTEEPEVASPAPSPVPPPVGERAKRSIPQDVKIAVSARDGGRCRQCGSTAQLHFDHVIPISRGGANTVANIQLLCGACNRAKGAKLK